MRFAELFRLVPGFTVSYVTYVKGLQPIVTYHGLGREFFSRLQVLIDGRSMNNATLGGVDWSEFPLALDDIDRIEVVARTEQRDARHRRVSGDDQFHHQACRAGPRRERKRRRRQRRDSRCGGARTARALDAIDYRITAGHRGDDGFANVADAAGAITSMHASIGSRAPWTT